MCERVWLLLAQKANKAGQVGGKEKYAIFQMLATTGERWQTSVQRPTPDRQRVRQSWGRVHAETVQSPLTVIFTESSTVVVLGTDNLYFLGARVPTSLTVSSRNCWQLKTWVQSGRV